MITFNNVLNKAKDSILSWSNKECLRSVTIVRDVIGKISFLLDNEVSTEDGEKQALVVRVQQDLGVYFSGKIYWKKLSHTQKNYAKRIEPIINMIENNHKEWKTVENIVFYIAERPIAKKAWIQTQGLQESVWSYEEAIQENGTKIITFYSFKGGMGRTTALSGVALALVKQGYNIMMIDTDIEAPGLATLFFDEDAIEVGVLDYLLEHSLSPEKSVTEYIKDITDPALLDETDGNLYLMPAGKVDENYLQKLARIDYQDNREGFLKEALSEMIQNIRNEYNIDYMLIDARAGFHDMGGIVVSQIPHGAVLFGNNSRQSWDGITQVLRTIAEGHTTDWPVMIVDSMCERPTSENYAINKFKFTQKAYTVCIENFYDNNSPVPGLDADEAIHSPEFVPFDSELLKGVELFSDGSLEQDDRVKAYKTLLSGNCYEQMANRIKRWFGED